MNKKLISNNQSLLLPKTMFSNKHESQAHIEQLGYADKFNSKPLETKNYYKFKPRPIGQMQHESKKKYDLLGSDPKTWGPHNQPKYHIQGDSKQHLILRKDLHMADTNKHLNHYKNIHDMKNAGLEFPTKQMFHNPRAIDHKGYLKKKLHEKIHDTVPLNLHVFSNIGGLQIN